MKKQQLSSTTLKINKINIANLTTIKGGKNEEQKNQGDLESYTCSVFPMCHDTLTTRPDSLSDG